MYIDLHTHTTASDGQYSPSELIKMAKEKGIERLAITDHDTVSGLKEAISLIHGAGGKAFLAYPGLLKFGIRNQESLIRSLKAAGLDGIECFYSKHEKKQEEYYLRLAKEYGLKVSCGSDFHGEKVKPGIELGMHLNENDLNSGMEKAGFWISRNVYLQSSNCEIYRCIY